MTDNCKGWTTQERIIFKTHKLEEDWEQNGKRTGGILTGAEMGNGRASVTAHIDKWELMKEEKGDGSLEEPV